jgi:hypothetical protein
MRRAFLFVVLMLLLTAAADATRLPHGAAPGSGGGGNTLTAAIWATSNEVGLHEQVSFTYTGTPPTGISSATWSGTGSCAGPATVPGGYFAIVGGLAQAWFTLPSGAGVCNLSVTDNRGATATVTGVTISAPGNDLSVFSTPGIYGDASPTLQQNFGPSNNDYTNVPFASYMVRGLVGPPTVATLTDTSGHAGDAANFSLTPNGYDPGYFGAGFQLCSTFGPFGNPQTSYFVDLTIGDGVTSFVKHLVINHPAANAVTFQSSIIFVTPGHVYGSQIVPDNANAWVDGSGHIVLGYLQTGTFTFSDPSGTFLYDNGTTGGGFIYTTASKLTSYGDYPVTVTASGGSPQTMHFFIVHDYQPHVSYTPNGILYSSTPVTNHFGATPLAGQNANSWRVGSFASYEESHGSSVRTTFMQNDVLSDSSSALELWNDGRLYLKASASPGTINTSWKSTGVTGKSTTMTLALPVATGTTLTGQLTGVIATGLTNFLTVQNFIVPSGSPKQAIALTASGFTPDWTKTNIDIVLPGGHSVQNVQFLDSGQMWSPALATTSPFAIVPRYQLSGASGSTANVVAYDLHAIDHLTSQTDPVVITVTDGNGTFDTETFNVTTNWCTSSTTEITVGPSNANYPSPTYPDMWHAMQAMWADYTANGQSSTMACTGIRLLRGVVAAADPATHTGWNYGVSSSFTNGYYPYPVHFFGDNSTQASFTGDITNGSGGAGTILHVTSVTGVGLFAGDMITSGVGSNKVILTSNIDASHWNVHIGPAVTSGTLNISATAMTTRMPRVVLDFGGVAGSTCCTAPGGSQQGAIMWANGYDMEVDGLDIRNVSNRFDGSGFEPGLGGTSGAFWIRDQNKGNLAVYNSSVTNSDNGILNSGPGSYVTLKNDIFARNGSSGGGNHDVYLSIGSVCDVENNDFYDAWVVHNFKSRMQYCRVTNNNIVNGINGLGSTPLDFAIGGDYVASGNIIAYQANIYDKQNSQTESAWIENEGSGNAYPFTWPYQNVVNDGNTYVSGEPTGVPLYQQAQVIYSAGWTQAFNSTVYYTDEKRNSSMTSVAQNSLFWNVPQSFSGGGWLWGGTADGGGNTVTTTLPHTAMELVDRVTGTYPFFLPPPGAYSYRWHASIGSAPGTYGASMVVPHGASSGTSVTNGLLCGIGNDWIGMTGPPTYSFVNISTVNNNTSFTLTPSGNCFQLKTNGSLADGVYYVELQAVGTGFSYGGTVTQPMTTQTNFFIDVGAWN